MSKRAIFAHAELPFWIEVAAKLRDSYGWDICYFLGKRNQKEKTLKLFPHTVFHTNTEAKKNIVPEKCKSVVPSPLDKDLLSSMSSYESIFLKMMDRYNFDGSMTYHKRINTYHSQLAYWKGVLEHFKPDIVVFRLAPHMGYDYTLYALCRFMDIPTLMFERTSLPGIVYPVISFETESEIISNAYSEALKDLENQEISPTPEVAAHLELLSQSYDKAEPYHQKYKAAHYKKSGEIEGYLSILWGTTKSVMKRHKDFHKNWGKFKRKKLLLQYQKLTKNVDLSKPYVFAALQCEPERQSCPCGDVFANQYLMIDMLSKLVPDDWKVYVKEHVSEFTSYQAAERSKTVEYYNMIAAMPKVELVPLGITSFELIDHAKAVSTVSGTIGWESVAREKPALLFGHSWFRNCNGVFVTHTIEACRKAIQEIRDGYKVNMNQVKCFAQVVANCSVRGYTDRIYETMSIIPHEDNVTNLTKAIAEFVS
jgi:hypothetical protein